MHCDVARTVGLEASTIWMRLGLNTTLDPPDLVAEIMALTLLSPCKQWAEIHLWQALYQTATGSKKANSDREKIDRIGTGLPSGPPLIGSTIVGSRDNKGQSGYKNKNNDDLCIIRSFSGLQQARVTRFKRAGGIVNEWETAAAERMKISRYIYLYVQSVSVPYTSGVILCVYLCLSGSQRII